MNLIKKVLTKDPDKEKDPVFWLHQGVKLLQSGNFSSAVTLFDKAILLDEENPLG